MKTQRWILAERPASVPQEKHFKLESLDLPALPRGQVLVRSLYISVDPYIRGRLRNVRSYVPPLNLGDVIEADVVGQIESSDNQQWPAGTFVAGRLGWSEFTTADPAQLRRIDHKESGLSVHLSVLGMTGLTAYFGLLDVGRVQEGETVLVSAAAGAVGSVVGQIAKIKGARAVGLAGSDQKLAYLKKIGFDAAINYKTETNLRKAIKSACPNGVDVYFDNVGGEISDAAISLINKKARVVICGQISTLNREKTETGPRTGPLYLLINRARMEGFLVMDYADRYAGAIQELSSWIHEGRLTHQETIVDGFENIPKAFIGLFTGDNTGKMLVKVGTPKAKTAAPTSHR